MESIVSILRDNWMLLLVGQYPNGPLGGLAITLALSVLGILLAFPLSVGLALARLSPFAWLRWPATAVVYVVRGVPLVMFIFWVYFFVPALIGRTVSGFTTMLTTLVIYQAAYLADIVRAGIEGLPGGQYEAARATGLSHMQAMAKVILPQAIYNMVPAMLSQFVSTRVWFMDQGASFRCAPLFLDTVHIVKNLGISHWRARAADPIVSTR